MVEMRVRYVRRHAPSGNDVAVLGPAGSEERPLIALTLSRPEALELSEELADRPTPRTDVYDFLIRMLDAAGASVTGIEVLDGPDQSAMACLRLNGPNGPAELMVEVGQAIGLAMETDLPLQVSEQLIQAVTPPPTTVPDQFRRAFDEEPGAPSDKG